MDLFPLTQFELSSKTWSEDRGPVLNTLKVLAGSGEVTEQSQRLSLDQKLASFKTPLSDGTKRFLGFIGPIIHNLTSYRETAKDRLIKRTDEIRQAYKKLAKSMAFSGYLPDVELIYYLSHYEIGQLLLTRSPLLIQKATRRRRLRNSWEDIQYGLLHSGVPKPVS